MLSLDFNPFPVLETPRLLLRRPLPEDAADLFLMRSDPEVMRYIPRPLAQTVADVTDVLSMIDGYLTSNERINWAIEWKETGATIGLIGYVNIRPEHHRGEVGYSLARAWHRRGIMREALAVILAYGFENLDFHSIEAIIDEENLPSGRLLEDAGFRREAHFLQDFLYNGQYRNSIHYGMLQLDWKGRAGAPHVFNNKIDGVLITNASQ